MDGAKCRVVAAEGAGFYGVRRQSADDDPSGESEDVSFDTGVAAVTARKPVVYAGFWLRLVAYLIDSLLLGIVVGVFIFMPLIGQGGAGGISPDNFWALYTDTSRQGIARRLLVVMAAWLYWALLESSALQATPGKRALGLIVTDLQGRRISFARASGRFFGKAISGFLLMAGYIMAAFTEKKQALHDMLAGCLVIRKD
jgi:uncharacterized RDD family membrane protein YckC